MSLAEQFHIGARIFGVTSIGAVSVNTSSNTATTQRDGVAIDRLAAGRRQYYSCKSIVTASLIGSSSQRSVSLALNFQHSDTSGSGFTDYSTGTVPAALTVGSTSGGAVGTTGTLGAVAELQQSVNLNAAKRWIKVQLTPTFPTSSSGDTLQVAGVLVFGGADEMPAQ